MKWQMFDETVTDSLRFQPKLVGGGEISCNSWLSPFTFPPCRYLVAIRKKYNQVGTFFF